MMTLIIASTEVASLSSEASAARPRREVRLDLNGGVAPSGYFRWKGYFDRTVAALLLIPGLPLIGLLVVLVRLTSRGPGLYRQVRVGKNNRRFRLYKIRTMRTDAEDGTGPVWSGNGDPRITPLGRLLRRYHMDELPQLLNVIRGEMSLVGPRPERPEFVGALGEAVPGYRNRLRVRPGVTGLAQVNLPADTDLCCVCRKVVLDLDYIQRAGLLLDIRVLLCTIARIPKFPAAKLIRRSFRVHREVTIRGCYLSTDNRPEEAPEIASDEATADTTDNQPCHAWRKLGNGNGQALKMTIPRSIGEPNTRRVPR